MDDTKSEIKRRKLTESSKQPTNLSTTAKTSNVSPSPTFNPFLSLLPPMPSLNAPTYLTPSGQMCLSPIQPSLGGLTNGYHGYQPFAPIGSPTLSEQFPQVLAAGMLHPMFSLHYAIRGHLLALEMQLQLKKKLEEEEKKEEFDRKPATPGGIAAGKSSVFKPVPIRCSKKTSLSKSESLGSQEESGGSSILTDSYKDIEDTVGSMAKQLKHLEILGDIIRSKKASSQHIQQATECRLCGNCSFATAGYQLAFMKQHLYTHIRSALFSCSLCSDYSSNAKTRVYSHLKKVHGTGCRASQFVKDNRLGIDKELCDLARQCYGSLIVGNVKD